MPRSFETKSDFPFQWNKSAMGVLHKYPNPNADHVVSMDVLDQSFDAETGLLRLERVIGVKQGAPGWAVRMLGGSEDTYVREVTMIDPSEQSLEMTSTNLSLSKYLLVKEYITYQPISPLTTQFHQRALIECAGLDGILASAARKVEDLSFGRFGANAAKGRLGLMNVLENLWGKSGEESSRL